MTLSVPVRLRKFIGLFILLALLIVYIGAAVTIAGYIDNFGVLAQVPYYMVAGIVWIIPARFVVRWMQ